MVHNLDKERLKKDPQNVQKIQETIHLWKQKESTKDITIGEEDRTRSPRRHVIIEASTSSSSRRVTTVDERPFTFTEEEEKKIREECAQGKQKYEEE